MLTTKLRILDMGSGDGAVSLSMFANILKDNEYELVRMDIDPDTKPDVVHDIRQPLPAELVGQFDLVMASHVLEHCERSAVIPALKNMVAAVRVMGELWVVVPALDWVAKEIVKGRLDHTLQLCIFGGGELEKPNYYYHHSGFTLDSLRDLFDLMGLVTRKAYQVPFGIKTTAPDGSVQETHGMQNVIIGLKISEEEKVEIVG